MEKFLNINFNEISKLRNFAAALSSPVRISIIQELCEKSMSVKELAFRLNIPMSSASENVRILENADLIHTFYQAGKHGSLKLCAIKYERVFIDLIRQYDEANVNRYSVDMPIGGFYDFRIQSTCGLVGEKEFIGTDDDVRTFYSPQRHKTQLLWFKCGYVEYRFSKPADFEKINRLQFSLEICSEAPGYRNDFPSDITFWINGTEICDWMCPGDFGGRRGVLTPDWWPINSTQYGLLKNLVVNPSGSFLDDTFASRVNLDKLNLSAGDYISFKIGVKDTARNVGGINIFGEKFGNHAQNIIMTVEYEKKDKTGGRGGPRERD